jgi:hypothetical protein
MRESASVLTRLSYPLLPIVLVLATRLAAFCAEPVAKRDQPKLANTAPTSSAKPRAVESLMPARSGPWGELEISRMYLEAPDALIAAVQRPNSTPLWNFPGGTEKSVRELLERAGLSAEVRERILDPERRREQDGVLTIYPPIADLKALPQSARDVIYPELGKSPLNEFHQNPIYITAGKIEAWLHDTQLTSKTRDLFRQMTWHSGSALAFSDIRTLLNEAASDAEVEGVFRIATRVRTFLVRLKVGPRTDFKALIDYWTNHGQSNDILPVLESLREARQATEIDVSHLLPPIPRRRLYTYPSADLAVRGRMPDCHWTSLNFFALTPQDQYLDLRLAASRVMEGYAPIDAPSHLGDVLLFLDRNGNAIHSCAFIADDIVFTKNGENSLTPWVFMRIADLSQIYLREPGSKMQVFRKKS